MIPTTCWHQAYIVYIICAYYCMRRSVEFITVQPQQLHEKGCKNDSKIQKYLECTLLIEFRSTKFGITEWKTWVVSTIVLAKLQRFYCTTSYSSQSQILLHLHAAISMAHVEQQFAHFHMSHAIASLHKNRNELEQYWQIEIDRNSFEDQIYVAMN